MISLMVLAVGFQLSSIYSSPVTIVEPFSTNSTVPPNACQSYKCVEFMYTLLLLLCIL